MNIGKPTRWHSKYICDKCQKEIPFIKQKGFVGINHYSKATQRETIKKVFDLCAKCEEDLQKWLKEKPIRRGLDMFERWEKE